MRPGILFALLGVGLMAQPLAAHPHDYVLGSGELALNVCDDDTRDLPGVGGVCILGGHIEPDVLGEAAIEIRDDSLLPSSGVYCQDLDVDGFCGEINEPYEEFCAELLLQAGVNWDPATALRVMPHSVVVGNVVLSPCQTLLSTGTTGHVYH